MISTPIGLELYSTLGTDPELAELVELFVAEMPERLAQLMADYQAGEWEKLGRTAHQLKGAAGSYGFHQLTPYAARLETAARGGGSPEQILECLQELSNVSCGLRCGAPIEGTRQGE
jgi:HPt (histidine-containing phosphotransfer) domain-containing protein